MIPVWHDLMTPDPLGVMDFYAAVFGWEGEAHDLGEFGEHVRFPSCGLVTVPEGTEPHWVAHLGVPDVAAAVEHVLARGGTVVAGPFRGPGGLISAVVRDDQGTQVGLSAAEEAPSLFSEAALACPDPERARAFWHGLAEWSDIQTGPARVHCRVAVVDLEGVIAACEAGGGSTETRGPGIRLRDPHGAEIDVVSRV